MTKQALYGVLEADLSLTLSFQHSTQAAYTAEQHPATTFEPPFVVGYK